LSAKKARNRINKKSAVHTKEIAMRTNRRKKLFLSVLLTAGAWLVCAPNLSAQNAPGTSAPADATPDIRQLADSVRQLQEQVKTLNTEVSQLKQSNEEAHAEARQLRNELHRTADQRVAASAPPSSDPYAVTMSSPAPPSATDEPASAPPAQNASLESRVTALEDNQELNDSRLREQSQTKVESGSKYRVRLTGIILANTFETVGSVNNIDFPQVAVPTDTGGTSTSFAGSLRQSQIGLEAFGPEIAGARTSASINFDFSGGLSDQPNGAVMGLPRLRTGVFRMDWENTSIIAGQDTLFIAPLTPTSLSSLAIPALSYSGNLWVWTPQIRVEHRVQLTDNSKLLLQAGIMDSLTGIPPYASVDRTPSPGEESGQPAYAARVAWSHRAFGRDVIIGAGGYYGRQNWYYGRTVDSWAGTTDVTVPLGRYFDFTGEFYRGRAVGGFGGGVGQSILLDGPIADPATQIQGLDSMGGWVQLKYKPKANFELNFAFGQDNAFASQLREYPASSYYYGALHPRNMTGFANFIYHTRSNVMFSVEYRRLQTYNLDDGYNPANQIGLSVGYIF
jgi:peptidoglycan hydrolase CwlO-like protein